MTCCIYIAHTQVWDYLANTKVVFDRCINLASVMCETANVGGLIGCAESTTEQENTVDLIINNCNVELEGEEKIESPNYTASISDLLGTSDNEYAGWYVGYNNVEQIDFDYTIKWVNYDGTVLETDEVSYNTSYMFDGVNPQREGYEFVGWTYEILINNEEIIYTTQWEVYTYIITWVNYDGTLLETDENVPYGTTPTYDGADPTKTPSLENAFAFDGWTTEVEEVTGDATYTAKFKNVAVAFYSLSVKETIGINFYLDIEKYTNDANAYVEIEYNHNTIDYAPDVRKDRIYFKNAIKDENKGIYRFSLSFSSGQIADNINIKLCSVGGETLFKKDNYSILTYCQTVITSEETKNDETLVNLCKSIIDYGKYAKEYFEYKPEVKIESDRTLPESIVIDSQEVTTEQKLKEKTGVANVKFERYSFVAYSDTSIRIYFKLENDASIEDYTASISPVDGSSMNVKIEGNNWGEYIEVYGIESANIDKVFTVTLTHKGGENTTSENITYSALHYLYETMEKTSGSQEEKNIQLRNMCLAIYQYNLCAKEKFGGNQ